MAKTGFGPSQAGRRAILRHSHKCDSLPAGVTDRLALPDLGELECVCEGGSMKGHAVAATVGLDWSQLQWGRIRSSTPWAPEHIGQAAQDGCSWPTANSFQRVIPSSPFLSVLLLCFGEIPHVVVNSPGLRELGHVLSVISDCCHTLCYSDP